MKALYIIIGSISLALGVLGIFLPLLPTTPFLLLSATMYAKSSTKLHTWLLNHKIFGKIIRTYYDDKSIPLKVKVIALLLLWSTLLFSIFFIIYHTLWIQIALAIVGVAVSIYLLRLKTKK